MSYVKPSEGKILSATVNESGRVVIPVEIREKLGIEPGTDLLFRMQGNSVEVYTRMQALKRVREYFKKNTPSSVDLAADLKTMRRAEFEKEEARYRKFVGQPKTRKKTKFKTK